MAVKMLMNVHEAIEYLENLDVSSEDELTDNKGFISRGRLDILPPNDKDDRNTDEYSRDRNELLPNNSHRSQFLDCYC